MASVTYNEIGLVVVLDHNEIDVIVQDVAGVGAGVGTIVGPALAAAHVAAPVIVVVEAVVVAYFGAQVGLIKQTDVGYGVYLTLPWFAILSGQWWLIVPTSRPSPVQPASIRWSDSDSGDFGTNDPVDSIGYQIERGVISAEIVGFRLAIGANASAWAKVMVMPDGSGNEWEIKAEGKGGVAENSLWAGQVNNGQSLRFLKPKFMGVWAEVLQLGQLDGLHPGDRVTFTWNRDQ